MQYKKHIVTVVMTALAIVLGYLAITQIEKMKAKKELAKAEETPAIATETE